MNNLPSAEGWFLSALFCTEIHNSIHTNNLHSANVMIELRATKSLEVIELEQDAQRLICFDPYQFEGHLYYRITPEFIAWATHRLKSAAAGISVLDEPTENPDYVASMARLAELEEYAIKNHGAMAVQEAKRDPPPKLPTLTDCPFSSGKEELQCLPLLPSFLRQSTTTRPTS